MGKGSERRPQQISNEEMARRWAEVFKHEKQERENTNRQDKRTEGHEGTRNDG